LREIIKFLVGVVIVCTIFALIPKIGYWAHVEWSGKCHLVVHTGEFSLNEHDWLYPDGTKCGDTWQRSNNSMWYVYVVPTWDFNKEFETFDEAQSYIESYCHTR
jgi:hypothetical protein